MVCWPINGDTRRFVSSYSTRIRVAVRNHVDTCVGVIGKYHRGRIGVLMFNQSKEDLPVELVNGIPQMILEQI